MRQLLKRWPFWLSILLIVFCLFSLWRLWNVTNLLTSQKAAHRWSGEDSESKYVQISCYTPPSADLHLNDIYKFRNEMYQKLQEASYNIEAEKGLYLDAWSTFGNTSISSGKQSGAVSVIGVGGDYFSFHPLRLLSGNYLAPNDVMDDRVLLDKESAWLLFGAVDVAGMSFSINGIPVVAAGVYEHERDVFSEHALGDSMTIYISYSSFDRLVGKTASETDSKSVETAAPICCYELVMAEPVKGFCRNAVKEKFPYSDATILENTYRYGLSNLIQILRNGMDRSMQKDLNYYPYWENAARAAEDRASFWLCAAAVSCIYPIVFFLYSLIRYAVYGKRKLETEILPAVSARSREFVREQNRRRWEKKHPDEF